MREFPLLEAPFCLRASGLGPTRAGALGVSRLPCFPAEADEGVKAIHRGRGDARFRLKRSLSKHGNRGYIRTEGPRGACSARRFPASSLNLPTPAIGKRTRSPQRLTSPGSRGAAAAPPRPHPPAELSAQRPPGRLEPAARRRREAESDRGPAGARGGTRGHSPGPRGPGRAGRTCLTCGSPSRRVPPAPGDAGRERGRRGRGSPLARVGAPRPAPRPPTPRRARGGPPGGRATGAARGPLAAAGPGGRGGGAGSRESWGRPAAQPWLRQEVRGRGRRRRARPMAAAARRWAQAAARRGLRPGRGGGGAQGEGAARGAEREGARGARARGGAWAPAGGGQRPPSAAGPRLRPRSRSHLGTPAGVRHGPRRSPRGHRGGLLAPALAPRLSSSVRCAHPKRRTPLAPRGKDTFPPHPPTPALVTPSFALHAARCTVECHKPLSDSLGVFSLFPTRNLPGKSLLSLLFLAGPPGLAHSRCSVTSTCLRDQ